MDNDANVIVLNDNLFNKYGTKANNIMIEIAWNIDDARINSKEIHHRLAPLTSRITHVICTAIEIAKYSLITFKEFA